MDGAAAVVSEGISQVPLRDAKPARLMERLERLLQETAEVEVELSRAEGTIAGLPHYSVVSSVDGPVELQELVGDCPCCRRSFFPAAGDVGI